MNRNTQSIPQFFHLQGYRRTRRTRVGVRSEACWSVGEVINEALRIPGSVPHIKRPQVPEVLKVDSPVDDVESFDQWIFDTMDVCQEADNARLRASAVALATYIVSVPAKSGISIAAVRELTLPWLQGWLDMIDVRLAWCITHRDETHPHLHLWAVPNQKQIERRRWRLSPAVNMKREDLIAIQDAFYAAVGQPLGLTRKGDHPQGLRLTRAQWHLLNRQPALLENNEIFQLGVASALRDWQTYLPQAALREYVERRLRGTVKQAWVRGLDQGNGVRRGGEEHIP